MIDIILALVALGVLVTVHETGHFLAARLCGVKVETFSIGFGKPLLKYRKRDIEYRIGWLPLGGFVKMKGDTLEEDAPIEPDSFQYTAWWRKIIIAFAGPFSNLVLAVLIFVLSFMLPGKTEDQSPVVGKSSGIYSSFFQPGDSIITVNGTPVKGWLQFSGVLAGGKPVTIKLLRNGKQVNLALSKIKLQEFVNEVLPAVSNTIGDVNPGMPAWRAGLKTGDMVIKVDTTAVNDWYQMREAITRAPENSVVLTIKRDGRSFTRKLDLEKNPLSKGQRMIGVAQIMPVSYVQKYPPLKAAQYGVIATTNFITLNYVGLYKLFSNPETIKSSVGGPVMIYSLSSQSAQKGWSSWIMFVAAISLVLMIMNLLPIPVLDGGHIMFALIQAVTGKPLPRKVQIILQNIGIILLLLLMVYAFYNDFTKVFARAYSNMGNP